MRDLADSRSDLKPAIQRLTRHANSRQLRLLVPARSVGLMPLRTLQVHSRAIGAMTALWSGGCARTDEPAWPIACVRFPCLDRRPASPMGTMSVSGRERR